MKIVVFEGSGRDRVVFGRFAEHHELVFDDDQLTAENAGDYADADIISPFIYSELDGAVLDQLKALKLIATRSTGYEHIDIARCEERGIVVSNVPRYGEATVAEHVFALLLALSHHIVEAANRVQRGEFSLQGLLGFDLHGKTIGVIGTGAIGRHVVRIAKGFQMHVVAFDAKRDEEAAKQLGFAYVDLDELLQNADIISLHVPAATSTYHMIGQREFAIMKNGVVVINTSRGSVIDSQALLRAVAIGRVAAAGLDVLEEEPVIREEAELLSSVYTREHDLATILSDVVMMRLKNVIITPHSAFHTKEAVDQILDTTADNIAAFLTGAPQNVVS
jgi:D-lactate dehydrogenase